MKIDISQIDEGELTLRCIPISSDGDFELLLWHIDTIKINNANPNKKYLYELRLIYNEVNLLNSIVDLEGFITTLKCFIDRKMHVEEKNTLFILKENQQRKSLQLIEDKKCYISSSEAMRMYKIITYVLAGYDLSYQYDKYITYINKFISRQHAQKYPYEDRRNITILKFDDYENN